VKLAVAGGVFARVHFSIAVFTVSSGKE
jgi:hypothetical protein